MVLGWMPVVDLSHIQDVDIDRWMGDRDAGKPWRPLDEYRESLAATPSPRTEPQECPSSTMISRFYVDDYIC